jgi:ribosomal protein L11 methylase PrmA
MSDNDMLALMYAPIMAYFQEQALGLEPDASTQTRFRRYLLKQQEDYDAFVRSNPDKPVPENTLVVRAADLGLEGVEPIGLKQMAIHMAIGLGSLHTGGTCWAAGDELAKWVLGAGGKSMLASASTAIELGSGAGLVSIALARLGVKKVVATDGDELTCLLCAENARHNGVSDRVETVRLDWADQSHVRRVLDAAGRDGQCSEVLLVRARAAAHRSKAQLPWCVCS